MACTYSFSRKRPDQKTSKESSWFRLWINGYTVKQLVRNSGHSRSKIQRIILYELAQAPPLPLNLSQYTHIVFDGKFLFGRKYCLLVVYDARTNKPIACHAARGENRRGIIPWLYALQRQGLNPQAVTTDGNPAGIWSFREVWPSIVTQRCLFHIKLQVTAWCRIPPRTELGIELTQYVNSLFVVKSNAEAEVFESEYRAILLRNKRIISNLDTTNILERDLLKAITVIANALPCLFHYLDDPKIAKTTSGLEGYFKQIQDIRGFRHSGLTEVHLKQFIAWRIYFDTSK